MTQFKTPTLQEWNTFSEKTVENTLERPRKYNPKDNEAIISFAFVPIKYSEVQKNLSFPESIFEYFTQEINPNRNRLKGSQEGQGLAFSMRSISDTEICFIKFHVNGVVTGRGVFDVTRKNGENGSPYLKNGIKLLLQDIEKFWKENGFYKPACFSMQITDISQESSDYIGITGNTIIPEEPLFIPILEEEDTFDLLVEYFKHYLGDKFFF